MGKRYDEDPFTASDVFDALGVQYRTKKNTQVICPQCKQRSFYMNMEKNVGTCFRSSCGFHGNQISYYAVARGISNKEAHAEMLAYKGISADGSKGKNYTPPKKVEAVKESDMADIEVRHSVYTEMAKILKLSTRHRNDLRARGLRDEEINRLGYCSFDNPQDLKSLTRILLSRGLNVRGVPGFFKNETQDWDIRSLKKGFLFPYRNREGKIQGYQLRKNSELLRTFENGRKEKKCNWLSSSGFLEGTGALGFCHYATDFEEDFLTSTVTPLIPNKKIILTEGALKGDIIHVISREPVIAVPGTGVLNEFEKELAFLKELGVEEIENAYDMDYLTNPNVQTDMKKAEAMIKSYGFRYKRRIWDTKVPNHDDLKGLDDYLAYHIRGI